MPAVVYGMAGLGDTIYQRPILRRLAELHGNLFVRTPWPRLVSDIATPVMNKGGTGLRTHDMNMAASSALYRRQPVQSKPIRPRYFIKRHGRMTIPEELEVSVGLPREEVVDMSLPDLGPCPVPTDRPIAVVRPVTVRREWANYARAPDPAYVSEAAKQLKARGFRVVTVAHVDPDAEPLLGVPPVADQHFLRGELTAVEVLALIRDAAVVVGGVGFIVPAAMATETPAVIIAGGQGHYNAPRTVLDQRVAGSAGVRFIFPDEYCECMERSHDCPKAITDFPRKLSDALDTVAVPCA